MINIVREDGSIIRHTDSFARALQLAMARKLKISVDTLEASLYKMHPIRYNSKSETYSTIISFENKYADVIVPSIDVYTEMFRGIRDVKMPKQNGCDSIW